MIFFGLFHVINQLEKRSKINQKIVQGDYQLSNLEFEGLEMRSKNFAKNVRN
jgi:hypothetical protein